MNPTYALASGTAQVYAATAEAAVVNAFRGTMNVEYNEESFDYEIGPGTLSTDAADQTPFLVVVSGNNVAVLFEDMAGQEGCDYDYNDRNWGCSTINTVTKPTGTVVYTKSYPSYHGANLSLTVSQLPDETLLWDYNIANNGLWGSEPIRYFNVGIVEPLITYGAGNTAGWTNGYDGIHGANGWSAYVYPPIEVGSSSEFWFSTAPTSLSTGLVQIDSSTGIEADIPGKPLAAKLESVTFSGTTNFPVVADPGDLAYDGAPHWLDNSLSGTIDVEGEHTLPVGFVRGDQMKISARIKVTAGDPNSKFAFVRADGPGNYDLPITVAPIVNGYIELPATPLSVPLINKVDYIPDFKFKWEVSNWQAPKMTAVGDSTNEFFATLAPAVNQNMYVTPLWLFCKGAKGSDTQAEAIAKAYSQFEGRNVTTHPDLDPLRNDPAVPKHYYKNWDVSKETFASMVTGEVLPTYDANGNQKLDANGNSITENVKDGKCQAWVDTLKHVFVEGGVPQATLSKYAIAPQIAPGQSLSAMFIKNWTFSQNGTATPPGFTHINNFVVPPATGNKLTLSDYIETDANKLWQYKWGNNPQVTDVAGLAGQNTSNPLSLFNMHFVMRIGDKIYDPSYGTSFEKLAAGGISAWDAAKLEWESASLEGIGLLVSYEVQNQGSFDKLAIYKRQPNTNNTVASQFNW